MQTTFDNLIGKIIQIYLDNLTIYPKNQEHHFDHLKKVFVHGKKFGMPLNPTKSIFSVIVGEILIHIVFDSGINIDPERVFSLQNI
jgi:hypothetical protein